jgi:fumarate reductase subunit D
VSRHSQTRTRSTPWALLGALGLGAVLTALAWLYLIGAAIDFGVLARRGQGEAWLFTAAASFGAIVCLVLFFALVGYGLRQVGLISDYQPRRAAPRRRK